jgi:hypothetical protein
MGARKTHRPSSNAAFIPARSTKPAIACGREPSAMRTPNSRSRVVMLENMA